MKKKRLLIEKSYRSGPTIEPCVIPVMMFSKLLYVALYGHIVFDSLNRRKLIPGCVI